MNMQLFHRLARRAGMLSLAALPVIGLVGPSEAEPGGLAGSWSGGGWVSFASGSKEKARCHARYTGGGGSYTVTATCATASGKASQTATIYKVSGSCLQRQLRQLAVQRAWLHPRRRARQEPEREPVG